MERENGSFLQYKVQGVPLFLFIPFAAIVLIAVYTGGLGDDMLSTMALLFVIGAISYEVGKRLPIWNKYIGGGTMMAIMLPSFFVFMGWLPEFYIESSVNFYDTISFQTLYICLLMAGGLLTVNRVMLIKTLARCGPVFIVGIITAALGGVLGAVVTGTSISEVLTYYVLPSLGGGNGAGAVPMSQIYEQITGTPKDQFYSMALALLNMADTWALILGILLMNLGKKYPQLTGDGTQLLRDSSKEIKNINEKKEVAKPTIQDIAAGLLVTGALWALSSIFGEVLLPKIGPVIIHPYAYFVIFAAIVNIFDLLPESLAQGTKSLQKFITGNLKAMCFAGVGITMIDFKAFVSAISIQNIIITLLIVIGVAIGTGLMGQLVGFYPVDAAITAGLCCCNRGGSGDVVILTATGRLELMGYASVLSRIGGAFVLALSSIVFTLMI
ncbi:MAG: 2-hydroxycarboxylate transporter family protein [Lachnospiraceae bacterium]